MFRDSLSNFKLLNISPIRQYPLGYIYKKYFLFLGDVPTWILVQFEIFFFSCLRVLCMVLLISQKSSSENIFRKLLQSNSFASLTSTDMIFQIGSVESLLQICLDQSVISTERITSDKLRRKSSSEEASSDKLIACFLQITSLLGTPEMCLQKPSVALLPSR